MLESGVRFEHVLEMIKTWSSNEAVAIESIDLKTEKLVCFDKFSRYLPEAGRSQKPCEWMYVSRETVELLKAVAPRDINRGAVTKYAK